MNFASFSITAVLIGHLWWLLLSISCWMNFIFLYNSYYKLTFQDVIWIYYWSVYFVSLYSRLVIFPTPGNNSFETSDFADQRFSFRNRDGGLFSPTIFLWKKILHNMKQMIIHIFFTKSFSLPELAN